MRGDLRLYGDSADWPLVKCRLVRSFSVSNAGSEMRTISQLFRCAIFFYIFCAQFGILLGIPCYYIDRIGI